MIFRSRIYVETAELEVKMMFNLFQYLPLVSLLILRVLSVQPPKLLRYSIKLLCLNLCSLVSFSKKSDTSLDQNIFYHTKM